MKSVFKRSKVVPKSLLLLKNFSTLFGRKSDMQTCDFSADFWLVKKGALCSVQLHCRM